MHGHSLTHSVTTVSTEYFMERPRSTGLDRWGREGLSTYLGVGESDLSDLVDY